MIYGLEVSNCVRNKRQVIHFFGDRTIKGNRHVLYSMCVSQNVVHVSLMPLLLNNTKMNITCQKIQVKVVRSLCSDT